MKKIIYVGIAFIFSIYLVGCGKTNKELDSTEYLDLTRLSSTVVYSEVYNMICTPESYLGKTVKLNGQFATYYDAKSCNYHFACVILDATACCQQVLEFVLISDYKYPEDYPEIGEEITVEGEFQIYSEGQFQYLRLINAELV